MAKDAAGEDAGKGAEEHLATQEEMSRARIPLGYRDHCSKLLIPLNKCRQDNFYLPWRCVDERHSYEKCQYDDFKRRTKVILTAAQKQLDEDYEV